MTNVFSELAVSEASVSILESWDPLRARDDIIADRGRFNEERLADAKGRGDPGGLDKSTEFRME